MITTTSSSFEISVAINGCKVLDERIDSLELPYRPDSTIAINAASHVSFRIVKPKDFPRIRISLGREVICTQMDEGQTVLCTDARQWFFNEIGESLLLIEQENPETGVHETVARVTLRVNPRKQVLRDFEVIIDELTRIHEGLAYDVVSRGDIGRGFSNIAVSKFVPAALLDQFDMLHDSLAGALLSISAQPSRILERTSVVGVYRAGDLISSGAVSAAVAMPENQFAANGEVVALRKARIRRTFLNEDIGEHRHIAHAIKGFTEKLLNVAVHFEEMAKQLYEDVERWGRKVQGETSVFEQTSQPRIDVLEDQAKRARSIAARFSGLIASHTCLKNARKPRTPFGPTPIFCNRPAYREVYRILTEARKCFGVLIDGDSIRVSYRNLATLYEYWCFVKTVTVLRELYGAPAPDPEIRLIHGIYRPDLKPGQKFVFRPNDNTILTVSYEPDIYPWDESFLRSEAYGATLTRNPLRPDILLELARDGEPPVLMVLDAKSTDRLDPARLWQMSDYARQIIERDTMRQPVRHVFILHRDESRRICNIPRYFNGGSVNRDSMVIGAVPLIPKEGSSSSQTLRDIVEAFVATFSGR